MHFICVLARGGLWLMQEKVNGLDCEVEQYLSVRQWCCQQWARVTPVYIGLLDTRSQNIPWSHPWQTKIKKPNFHSDANLPRLLVLLLHVTSAPTAFVTIIYIIRAFISKEERLTCTSSCCGELALRKESPASAGRSLRWAPSWMKRMDFRVASLCAALPGTL